VGLESRLRDVVELGDEYPIWIKLAFGLCCLLIILTPRVQTSLMLDA
jgi:hypothetical protein